MQPKAFCTNPSSSMSSFMLSSWRSNKLSKMQTWPHWATGGRWSGNMSQWFRSWDRCISHCLFVSHFSHHLCAVYLQFFKEMPECDPMAAFPLLRERLENAIKPKVAPPAASCSSDPVVVTTGSHSAGAATPATASLSTLNNPAGDKPTLAGIAASSNQPVAAAASPLHPAAVIANPPSWPATMVTYS